MDSFLVLGIIPGTDLQITFGMWLLLSFSLTVALLIYWQRHVLFDGQLYRNVWMLIRIYTVLFVARY